MLSIISIAIIVFMCAYHYWLGGRQKCPRTTANPGITMRLKENTYLTLM